MTGEILDLMKQQNQHRIHRNQEIRDWSDHNPLMVNVKLKLPQITTANSNTSKNTSELMRDENLKESQTNQINGGMRKIKQNDDIDSAKN